LKLTTKARYAVMAMVDLAAATDGTPVALASIAGRQQISLSYLEQLFARLRRAGLVGSVRGPGGGYLLGVKGRAICIADIVRAVDEPIRATRCAPADTGGCLSDGRRCMTHDLWEELGSQIDLFLSAVSLGDVVDGALPKASRPGRRLMAPKAELSGEALASKPAERLDAPSLVAGASR
jgi:Rrf2 family iron-sulfur cluster assembly transcriptional regulator